MLTLSASLLTLSLVPSQALAAYSLVKEYSGSNFFDGWVYGNAAGYDDKTNGAVNWLNQSAADTDKLTFVNNAGNAIIKVDNTTNLPNATYYADQQKRNSIEISSSDFYPIGSVFVLDAVHVPFGCSVWPAFWTRATNWPHDGEIDILESVNLQTFNQMSLHTDSGCTQPSNVTQLGKLAPTGADCSAGTSSAIGCGVQETKANSFGQGLNDAGGGVWAAQFDVSGIYIWFWSRKDIPASVSGASNSIDTSSWGEPSAAWPASTCNGGIAKYFAAQQLIIDITLCGDDAGNPDVYQATCSRPGVVPDANTCYIQNVNGTGANYAEAYFEISYVKVFTANGTTLTPTTSAGSTFFNTQTGTVTAAATSSANGNSNSGSASGGNNGAIALTPFASCVTVLSSLFAIVLVWASL